MAVKGISAPAVAAAGMGALFLWSGITNRRLTDSLRSILAGQNPPASGAYPLASSAAPMNSVGSGSGSTPIGTNLGGYSNSQLQSLWVMAGGNPAKAGVAACIASAESSGNPKALNVGGPGPGCDAVGLWQLATPCGKGAGFTVPQLQDAVTNARVAVKASSNGTDWSAWSTAGSCGV